MALTSHVLVCSFLYGSLTNGLESISECLVGLPTTPGPMTHDETLPLMPRSQRAHGIHSYRDAKGEGPFTETP